MCIIRTYRAQIKEPQYFDNDCFISRNLLQFLVYEHFELFYLHCICNENYFLPNFSKAETMLLLFDWSLSAMVPCCWQMNCQYFELITEMSIHRLYIISTDMKESP